MSDVIYNETGIGDLKGKTPNYNFNIPYFDIATWHDYIEENFRSIDALFHYIYEIKQYKGKWENNTTYKVDDVLFIIDDNSEFNGRLVKVLIEHTTSDKTFDEFFTEHNDYYELFLDASAAHEFAVEAKSSSEIAKEAEENCKMYSETAYNSMQQANNSAIQSQNSENSAYNYQKSAKNSANIAQNSAKIVKYYPYIENNLLVDKELWKDNEDNELSVLFKNTYPYSATIQLKNDAYISQNIYYVTLTGSVCFSPNDVVMGDYAPISDISIKNDGKFLVTIYSKKIPSSNMIIETVMIYCSE